jgi:hypothetical protein
MREFLASRKPSPAMGVAFVALLAALSGTAIALPGTNSVDSGDIKNGTIRGKDIHRNAVTGKKVKNRSLTGADVKDNRLTGVDINESTLGQVPSATSANTANSAKSAVSAGNSSTVGGNAVRAFSLIGPSPLDERVILDLDGLQLSASCVAGAVTVTARTTTADSEIAAFSHDASDAIDAEDYSDSFNPGDSFILPHNSPSDEVGQGRFSGGNGKFVDFTYSEEDDLGANDCVMHGFAMGN